MRRSITGLLALLLAAPAIAQDTAFSDAPTLQEIQAQQRACEARNPPQKAAGSISEGTYKRLERIIDAIGKGNYGESETKLKELTQSSRSDYEKAIVLQTLGFVYAQTDREQQAIKTFEEALATKSLPQQVHEQMMFNIAQLHLAQERYDQGMAALNRYLDETCNPLAEAHVLLASVYAEKKRWRDAVKQVDLALVKSKSPKESWYQVKLAAHYELKEYAKCAEVLLRLVAFAPHKQEYWKQLHGVLFEVKKDPDALAVLALAERKGFIDEENEYKNLTNMYMYMNIPIKAAHLMQRGMEQKQVPATEKNLSTLADAWLSAREYEKAEGAMERAAAASDKGDLYKRLGQIRMEQEKWKEALAALQMAQKKGGVKDPGELAFLLGVCAVELKQWNTADAALRQAMQHEKTSKMAAQWLAHLQQEIAYQQQKEADAEAAEQPPETQTN